MYDNFGKHESQTFANIYIRNIVPNYGFSEFSENKYTLIRLQHQNSSFPLRIAIFDIT